MAIDFPNNPTPTQSFTAAGKTWNWDGTSWKLEFQSGSGGGTTSFTGLIDTPVGYEAGKWLKVNSAANGLEWTDAPSGGSGGVDLTAFSVTIASAGTASLSYDNTTGVFTYTPPNLSGLLNVNINNPQTGEVIKYDGTNWVNSTDLTGGGGGGGASSLFGLSDCIQTGLTLNAGEVLRYNGANWSNYDISINIPQELDDLVDVSNATPSDGQVLKWSAANSLWMPATDLTSSGGTGIVLTDLSVTTASAAGGGSLSYNNSNGTFTFTPALIPAQGATVSISETPPSNPTPGDLWWKSDEGQLKVWYDDGSGTPSAQWVDTGGPGTSGGGSGGGSGSGGISLADLSVTTLTATNTPALTYDVSSGVFSYTPPDLSEYSLYNHGHSYSLNDLSDVDTTGAAIGKIIKHDGTSWIAVNDTSSTTFVGLTDTPNSFTANKWLKVNAGGTALEFTDAPSGGGGSSGNDSVAVGTIAMWSGTIATIPTGWALCDGNNGTPNLLDKFVIGASDDDSGNAVTGVTGGPTQTGGSKDAIVVDHSHSSGNLTVDSHSHGDGSLSVDSHSHSSGSLATDVNTHAHAIQNQPWYTNDVDRGQSDGASLFSLDNAVQTSTDNHSHQHNVNSGNTGSESPDVSGNTGDASPAVGGNTSSEGSSGTNANLPPYYALAYIMKITAGGGGSTDPGGSNTQFQWNDDGDFGGTSKVTWDNTNSDMVFEGTSVSNALRWDSSQSALRLESSSVEMQFVGGVNHIHKIEQSGDYLMVGAKGTGAKLYLDATSTIKFITAGDAANVLLEATDDGPVNLYYAYGKKFETTLSGVQVTGGIQDKDGDIGNPGQILSSTGSELDWIDAPSGGNGIVTANVKDFGALGDDNNDDTNAINSAIASLANNASQYEDGGIVYFPPGIYRISSPLQLSSGEHSITLKGSSTHFPLATGQNGGSILRSTSTTANLIEITNVTSISVQNLSVDTYFSDPSDSKINGVAIRCESTTNIQGVTIDQFYVKGFPKGIEIHGYSNCMIKNSEIRELPEVASLGQAETHGILLTQGSDGRQDQIRLENVIVDAKNVSVAEDYHDYANGIILKKWLSSVWIKDCAFLHCNNGIWFSSELNHSSDNGMDGAFHRVLNSDVDHNKNHGIIVDGGDCIWFENCYASSNLQMGFYMGANFDGTVWINNIDCRGNGSHGIHVNANAAGTFINSARCYNNGVKDSGNKSGLYVVDTAYNVRIIGGQFGGDNEGFNTGAQQHGIKFLGTDHKQSLISGCNVLGNSADGISFDSTALNDPSYYNFITCCAGTTLNNVT